MLHIKDLVICYDKVKVLKEVSLEVNRGEIVTLIGANGAGKSSILRAISGLVKIVNGRIIFEGQDITGRKPHEIVASGICQVPEGRKIFADQTVLDNLILGAYTIVRKKKKHVQDMVEREFSRFPILRDRRNQLAGTLSGGEQQMLAMSRALMLNPKLLLLDEPSMGLAPLMVDKIIETILEIEKAGITILLVEQMASLALEIADRAYVIQTGTVKLSGTGKELLDSAAVVESYLGGQI